VPAKYPPASTCLGDFRPSPTNGIHGLELALKRIVECLVVGGVCLDRDPPGGLAVVGRLLCDPEPVAENVRPELGDH
jgi:hypothetical protein